MTLAKYADIYSTPVPPLFETVTGVHHLNQAQKIYIIIKLFPSNLRDFQTDGRLFSTLETMAATVIMSYNKMRTRYGCSNVIVYKVSKLFELDVNLSLDQLCNLSTQIRSGFIKNNQQTC